MPAAGARRVATSLVLGLAAGCSEEPRARSTGENLVVVTVCGLRGDTLAEGCASGAAATLARLRDGGAIAAAVRASSTDCRESIADLVGPLAAAMRRAGGSLAAFVSRSELIPDPTGGEFHSFDGPPIERFSASMFGEAAAEPELRRSAGETATAAIDWLAGATSPFFAWIELDALAIEAAEDEHDLPAVARTRLAEVDAALGRILAELRRADRQRRTLLVFASDHGEELGEEGWFGHRRAVPCVSAVPVWVHDPGLAWEGPAEWPGPRALAAAIVARLGLADARGGDDTESDGTREPRRAESIDALPFLVERGEIPRTDAQARAALGWIRPLLDGPGAKEPRVLELFLMALHALDPATEAEQAEAKAARERWLDRVAAALPRRPFAATLLASPNAPETTIDRRRAAASHAVSAAPWYFPAVRVQASLEQMELEPRRALETLERFDAKAPLAPAAREEFARLLEETRRRLGVR